MGMVGETRGRWQTWEGDVEGHETSMALHAYDGYTWGWWAYGAHVQRNINSWKDIKTCRIRLYLFSIHHKNLTPHRFVTNSCQMTSSGLFQGLQS